MNKEQEKELHSFILGSLLGRLVVLMKFGDHGQVMNEDLIKAIKDAFEDADLQVPPNVMKDLKRK